ncbi:unnamed protein product, partial [Ectocarpus sp. 12 AP-2014]
SVGGRRAPYIETAVHPAHCWCRCSGPRLQLALFTKGVSFVPVGTRYWCMRPSVLPVLALLEEKKILSCLFSERAKLLVFLWGKGRVHCCMRHSGHNALCLNYGGLRTNAPSSFVFVLGRALHHA